MSKTPRPHASPRARRCAAQPRQGVHILKKGAEVLLPPLSQLEAAQLSQRQNRTIVQAARSFVLDAPHRTRFLRSQALTQRNANTQPGPVAHRSAGVLQRLTGPAPIACGRYDPVQSSGRAAGPVTGQGGQQEASLPGSAVLAGPASHSFCLAANTCSSAAARGWRRWRRWRRRARAHARLFVCVL